MAARFSNYMITINSNMVNSAANRRLAGDAMRAATEAAMREMFNWIRPTAAQHRRFTRGEQRDFLRVRARVAFEHGAAQNAAPHCHTLLEIMHNSSLWANFDDLKRIIRANLDGMTAVQRAAVNIDVRFVRGDDVGNVLHYLLKDGVPAHADAAVPHGPDMRMGGANPADFPRPARQYDGWDRDRRNQEADEEDLDD